MNNKQTSNPAEKSVVHIWEKVEIVLEAEGTYSNPYTEVDVWVDLSGPGFEKRVYGFWDGGRVFKVRLVATAPGEWKWQSGSNTSDRGLNGKSGEFQAVEWDEKEKEENPCRRGFIYPTPNGHAFMYADGTPFLLLGDTWWATPTYRYKWYEDELSRPIGPDMGFKDMVKFRKSQGYNCIAMLAAFPTWANDGLPPTIHMDDEWKTAIRAAWEQAGTNSAKDMHNEGGRPFCFPGKVPGYEDVVPDFDRINPEYFKHMDKKVDYLNDNGFVPFIEVARRDISQVWKRYYDWPASYARFIQYIFARYQANNCLLSPIHFDYAGDSIPSFEYNEPANMVVDKYGHPPFGNLVGTNASPSTLVNFGGPDQARWLTFHQIGNWREHDHHWYMTEIYYSTPPMPAVNGEPYYPGFPDDDPPAYSEEADLNCRSGMYGGFLSGGFGGYIYGAEGLWGADIEPDAKYRMWDAMQFESGKMVRCLEDFAFVNGNRYQDLEPNADLVTPNKAGDPMGYRGWAYCARTKEKDFFLIYLEKDCPQITVRGAIPNASYLFRWFNPRTGAWFGDVRLTTIKADGVGRIRIPAHPADKDWGLSLILEKK